MKYPYELACATAILTAMATGCSPDAAEIKTVRNGIHTVPHVQEIRKLFPNDPTDHFITDYYIEKNKPHQWNTEAFFGGKYILTYQVYVEIDYDRHRIGKITSKRHFSLYRIARVIRDESGKVIGSENERGRLFGEDDWNKVVAANGDFSVIGIQLKTNSPVPGFDECVHSVRGSRWWFLGDPKLIPREYP